MKKKIAVFLGNIIGDAQESIYKAITSSANGLGYDVVAFCTYGLYNDDYLYSEGEKTSIYIPDFSTFDGVIVSEDVFNIDGMSDDLYEVLNKTAKCPIVYLRTKREKHHCILTDNVQGIKEMTKHFTDVHGFTDICFMSGKKEAKEAAERLSGFMEAMNERNIPVNEHMIFYGDFWRGKAVEALNWFMEGRDKYPQAIICANDYMALSICEELRNRGIRVPEDVCVSGFDYVLEARQYQPTITSVYVNFNKTAKKAVEIIDKTNHGEKCPNVVKMVPDLKLHKSCGCGKQLHYDKISQLIDEDYRYNNDAQNHMQSISEYQDAFEEEDYLAVCEKHGSLFKSNNAYVCMCDTEEKNYKEVEKDSLYTEHMILKRILHGNRRATKITQRFLRSDILPEIAWSDDEPKNYMLFVVHYKNIVYGYIAAEFPDGEWFNVYSEAAALCLGTAVENSLVRKTMADLEAIKAVYQKDALTGILNRRGIDKHMKEILKSSEEKNLYYVASIDMDDLKYINDNFGHLTGDEALKKMAGALKSVIHDNELCGRIGGDEFQAFLVSQTPDRVTEFVRDFENAIANINNKGLPYIVDASVGVCGTHEDKVNSLISCIQMADMRMYENKRKRKKGRES